MKNNFRFIDENTKVYLTPGGIRFIQGKSYWYLAGTFFAAIAGSYGLLSLLFLKAYHTINIVLSLYLLAVPGALLKREHEIDFATHTIKRKLFLLPYLIKSSTISMPQVSLQFVEIYKTTASMYFFQKKYQYVLKNNGKFLCNINAYATAYNLEKIILKKFPGAIAEPMKSIMNPTKFTGVKYIR